jgi:hypothetical protein
MLSLAQLVEAVKDVEQRQEGIWVRLYNDLKICLMGVEDAPTGKFTAKFFPCAKNSRLYSIAYGEICELEKAESKADPGLWYSSAFYYRPKSGT